MTYADIYPFGECTYGAALPPNDWVLRYGNLGNADEWGDNWKLHGGALSPVPVVGAIASFKLGADNSSPEFGHVGDIIAVNGDQFQIREMNYSALGVVDTRWCTVGPNISYLLEAPMTTLAELDPAAATALTNVVTAVGQIQEGDVPVFTAVHNLVDVVGTLQQQMQQALTQINTLTTSHGITADQVKQLVATAKLTLP